MQIKPQSQPNLALKLLPFCGWVGYHGSMQYDVVNLGREVSARRDALGLNQNDLKARGGPSDGIVRAIENGEWVPGRAMRSTLAKLDDALLWVAGSAANALAGGKPTERAQGVGGSELSAMEQVGATIAGLDAGARRRVLRWAWDRYMNTEAEGQIAATAGLEGVSA